MLKAIIISLYFILPAYVANMFPVIFGKMKLPLGIPIHEKLFGSHKTWRGFYAAYIGAFLALLVQYLFFGINSFQKISILNYGEINIFLYAFLFGIGALTGDLIKSFFKRLIGIDPGGLFFPFDQIDFILGALVFLSPFVDMKWWLVLVLLIVTPILHLLANIIGYLIGFKKVWW